MFYQVFYFYTVIPNCTTSCKLPFADEFVGDIPNNTGFSIWSVNSSSLPSTRLLFAICWLFQLFSILFIPFALTKGTKSIFGSTLGLISGGSAVVLFFFLPTALYRDYNGKDCANMRDISETPCSSFFHQETIFTDDSYETIHWGPSYGFYIAMGNILLQGIIFMLVSFMHPCACGAKPTSMDWLYEDIFSESNGDLDISTSYSSTILSDDDEDSSYSINDSKPLLTKPGDKRIYSE